MKTPMEASAYWGKEKIWDFAGQQSQFDDRSAGPGVACSRDPRSRQSQLLREGLRPPFGKALSDRKERAPDRVLDPKTMKYTFVDTCFGTHHLQFGYDANNTVWTSGGGPVLGWVNTKMFDETGDAAKSQGWTAFVLDTNGNGKRDEYVEPNQPVDPTKDKRIAGGFYAVMPEPGRRFDLGNGRRVRRQGAVVRVDPGPNPPATALREVYNIPLPGFGPRGGDIDSKGVVWVSLASGHIGSFDRRQCKGPLERSDRHGRSLPRGLDILQVPGAWIRGHRR